MRLDEARTPQGVRLYAIGDVHGRDDLLAEVHARIAADLSDRPPQDYRVIHCGDYVDRGPDSAAVVRRLAALRESDGRVVCMRGNHEDMLLGFLDQPARFAHTWLANGGDATLLSYGLAPGHWFMTGGTAKKLATDFAAALPSRDESFLRNLELSRVFGDFLFVHAGIRPGIPLEAQEPEDLTWIREEFLDDMGEHDFVVVHGHTPAPEPEVRPNRINIDTGAVFSGRLTCLVLDGDTHHFL